MEQKLPAGLIKLNIEHVLKRISDASARAGRNPADLLLIAVTKGVGIDRIREAYDAGLRDFGENYAQEAIKKISVLPADIRWHFIGRIQKNKVKYIAPRFASVHSIDREDIAEALDNACKKTGRKIEVLIQVNTSGKESRAGIILQNTLTFLKNMLRYNNLMVRGLMTMPPYSDNPEDSRACFSRLKELRYALINEGIPAENLKELSMGMSGDFEVAVEEGATLLRIGTAIFGPRN